MIFKCINKPNNFTIKSNYFNNIIILKEKFHFRYIIGTSICLSGAFIIILNERKVNSSSGSKTELLNKNDKPFFSTGTLIGITCAFVNVLFASFISIANKILARNKIPITSQLFYVGISTLFYSFIYILFKGCPYCFGYIIGSMGHSIGFYCGNVLFNMDSWFFTYCFLYVV